MQKYLILAFISVSLFVLPLHQRLNTEEHKKTEHKHHEEVLPHLHISHAWARSTRQKAYVGAAYVTIANSSPEAETIVAAASDVAKRIELHTHIHGENDTMKMVELNEITVAPEGKTELKPGATHLMFFGLKQPFETGNRFDVTFTFKSGASKVFSVVVGGPASKDYNEVLEVVATATAAGQNHQDPNETDETSIKGGHEQHDHHGH